MVVQAELAPVNAIYPCSSKREDLDYRNTRRPVRTSWNRLRSAEQKGNLHSASKKDEAARGIELGAVQAANASNTTLAPLSILWPRELQELVLVPSHATSPDLLLHPGHTTNHEYLQREQPTRPNLSRFQSVLSNIAC